MLATGNNPKLKNLKNKKNATDPKKKKNTEIENAEMEKYPKLKHFDVMQLLILSVAGCLIASRRQTIKTRERKKYKNSEI